MIHLPGCCCSSSDLLHVRLTVRLLRSWLRPGGWTAQAHLEACDDGHREGLRASLRPEAALLGSAGPLPPPALAGAAGLAGITALAFSSMATT